MLMHAATRSPISLAATKADKGANLTRRFGSFIELHLNRALIRSTTDLKVHFEENLPNVDLLLT